MLVTVERRDVGTDKMLVIPSSTRVGEQISSILDQSEELGSIGEQFIGEVSSKEKPEGHLDVVAEVKDWEKSESPPSGEFVLKWRDMSPFFPSTLLEDLPNRVIDCKNDIRIDLDIKRVIDTHSENEYIFDDSGKLIPESQSQESYSDSHKNEISPAYVSSVVDNLTNNAKQTSKASECRKYLKEIQDTLKESDINGKVYDNILEDLEILINRVESNNLPDNLDDERVGEIDDIAHRIKRLCQRKS